MSDSPAKIGVIDYGAGNLRSVCNALAHLGCDSLLVRGPDDFAGLDRLILPGVGAFGDCAEAIDRQDLRAPLMDWLVADRPFFGICVGYQVLFSGSEESPGCRGLGFFEGDVVKFSFDRTADSENRDLKVPHMGWNQIAPRDPGLPLWQGLPENPHVYFVHSYYPQPADTALISATTDYGGEFAAAIQHGNITATQFHPERSQSVGLRLLGNFLEAEAPAKAVSG